MLGVNIAKSWYWSFCVNLLVFCLYLTLHRQEFAAAQNATKKELLSPRPLFLQCDLSNVTLTFELFKDGKLVAFANVLKDGTIQHNHTLGSHFEVQGSMDKILFSLEKTKLSDQGKYVCLSKKNMTTIFKTEYDVTILAAPVVTIPDHVPKVSVYVTQSLSLTCTATGNPIPTIEWRRADQLVVKGPKFYVTSLELSDAGIYQCVAKNKFGIHFKSVDVMIKLQTPGSPTNFSSVVIKEKSIVVKWLPALKGRTETQKYILSATGTNPPDRTIAPDIRQITLDGLNSFTTYYLTLKACNGYGCGKPASLTVRTLEQGRPTGPTNVNAFRVTSTTVSLTWTPGAHSSKPILKYNIFYREAQNPVGNTVDAYTIPFTVKGLKPYTNYILEVTACINGSTQPLCSLPTKDGYTVMTKMAAPGEACCFSLKNTRSVQLQLMITWGPPMTMNGPNVTYKIFYKVKSETKWEVIPLGDGRLFQTRSPTSSIIYQYELDHLKGPTDYEILINVANSVGSTNTSVVVHRTDEPVPGSPIDLKLVSQTSSSIVVSWKRPPFYTGVISNYHVTITRLPDGEPLASVTKTAGPNKIDSLFENTKYQVEVHATVTRARDKRLLISPKISRVFSTAVKKVAERSPAKAVDTTLIIVTVICIVVMIAVVVMTLIYCRKKNVFGVTYKSTFYVLPESGLHHPFRISMRKSVQRQPVKVENFGRHMSQMHADSDYLFSEEYGSLHPCRAGLSYEHSSSQLNKPKNRYPDIVAYDHSRVRLTSIDGIPASSYINANFVDGYKRKNAFIATQAPLTRTFEDFWRMVVEQDARVIVMLTNLMERGRRKCDQYWPNEGKQHYGTISVQTTEERRYAYFTVRTFLVVDEEEKREEKPKKPFEIKQFHFTDWPDFDVPRERATIMTFLWWIRRYCDHYQGPIVCHCSAGVGRTGTFIVLDSQIRRVDEEKSVDVYNFLRHIRTQRNYLVQQERQYIFIHDALADYIISGRTEIPCRELRDTVMKESFISIGKKEKSKIDKEWEAINTAVPGDFEMQVGRRPCNIPKNRDQFVIPVDICRVRLTVRAATEDTDYINASYIDTFLDKKAMIVTQSPVKDTVEDFWRMIWENYSVLVVCLLSELDCRKEDYSDYLPTDNCNPINFGVFEVNCLNDVKVGFMRSRELEITHRVPWGESEKRRVYHYQFLNWADDAFPPPNEVFQFMQTVKEKQDDLHSAKGRVDKAPIVVHCSCGIGRCGIYCVLENIKEQLEDQEGVVDVYTTVKILRRQRPYFIQTIDQYQYCYKAAVQFYDSLKKTRGTNLIEIDGSEEQAKMIEADGDSASIETNEESALIDTNDRSALIDTSGQSEVAPLTEAIPNENGEIVLHIKEVNGQPDGILVTDGETTNDVTA